MLLACPSCHRQYDVGDHAPGAHIRCLCGHLATVPAARPRRVEMLHCSNCGGRLASSSSACPYCSAEPKLADIGLGPACPECLATTMAGAKHCSACGVRIDPQAVVRALTERPCPRCKQPLSECESDKARYVECTGCGGLWLDEPLFERIASARDDGLATALRGEAPSGPVTLETPVRYLPCPVCAQIMHRRNFASCSGVVIDWCRGHGWWFDATELGRILDFIAAGGLEKARAQRIERQASKLARLQREERILGRPETMPMHAYVPGSPLEGLIAWALDSLLH
jgi:Zn-finger nucleic acid-binding protein